MTIIGTKCPIHLGNQRSTTQHDLLIQSLPGAVIKRNHNKTCTCIFEPYHATIRSHQTCAYSTTTARLTDQRQNQEKGQPNFQKQCNLPNFSKEGKDANQPPHVNSSPQSFYPAPSHSIPSQTFKLCPCASQLLEYMNVSPKRQSAITLTGTTQRKATTPNSKLRATIYNTKRDMEHNDYLI